MEFRMNRLCTSFVISGSALPGTPGRVASFGHVRGPASIRGNWAEGTRRLYRVRRGGRGQGMRKTFFFRAL